MSTSLLYHAFGINDCHYHSTQFQHGQLHFQISVKKRLIRCPHCRSRKVIKKGKVPRTLQTVPVGRKQAFIHLDVPRVYCANCGTTRQINLPFARPYQRHTRAFERLVIQLSSCMTIKHIAQWLGVGWDAIKDIIKLKLKRDYSKPKLKGLRRIAIDEIYLGKKQKFMTLVLDLEKGQVVYTAKGKHTEALAPFWKRLKRNKVRIEAVATDMGAAYIKAVRENIPEATLVFDHFHLIKLFNEKLTKLRQSLFHEQTQLNKHVLKGTRWLLLKRSNNLNEEKNERERLEEALKLNEPLAKAYYLKEDLAQIWLQKNKEDAEEYLKKWAKAAEESGVNMLKKFGNKLLTWRKNILAYYETDKLSTGPLEGVNNKIKVLKRMAYGYRDHEFFELKILSMHDPKYGILG